MIHLAVALCSLALLAAPLVAESQQARRLYRVGSWHRPRALTCSAVPFVISG
jgi:hypothetical protein